MGNLATLTVALLGLLMINASALAAPPSSAGPTAQKDTSNCSEVLKLDLRDRWVDYGTESYQAAYRAWACSASTSDIQSSHSGSIDVVIPGLDVPVGGSYDDAVRKYQHSDACNETNWSRNEYKNRYGSRDTVNKIMSEAITAWKECVGVIEGSELSDLVRPSIRFEKMQGDESAVRLFVKWSGASRPDLRQLGITAPGVNLEVNGLTCAAAHGGKISVSSGFMQSPSGAQFICHRGYQQGLKRLAGATCRGGFAPIEIAGEARTRTGTFQVEPLFVPPSNFSCACGTAEAATDVLTDISNCGSCGRKCSVDNGSPSGTCSQGTCSAYDHSVSETPVNHGSELTFHFHNVPRGPVTVSFEGFFTKKIDSYTSDHTWCGGKPNVGHFQFDLAANGVTSSLGAPANWTPNNPSDCSEHINLNGSVTSFADTAGEVTVKVKAVRCQRESKDGVAGLSEPCLITGTARISAQPPAPALAARTVDDEAVVKRAARAPSESAAEAGDQNHVRKVH